MSFKWNWFIEYRKSDRFGPLVQVFWHNKNILRKFEKLEKSPIISLFSSEYAKLNVFAFREFFKKKKSSAN